MYAHVSFLFDAYVSYALLNHEQVALDLIKAGSDLEKQAANSFTALMLACQNGHNKVGTRFLGP